MQEWDVGLSSDVRLCSLALALNVTALALQPEVLVLPPKALALALS